MYKRKPDGWLKHVDFIILDLLSMHLAFVIAFVIRQGAALPYADSFYRNIAIVLSLFVPGCNLFNIKVIKAL